MNITDAARPGFRGAARLLAAAIALTWRASRTLLVAQAVTTLIAGAVPVTVAWLTKTILDRITEPAPAGGLLILVVGLAVATMTGAMLPEVGQYLDAELIRRTQLAGQQELYAAIGRFDGLGRFEDPAFQDRLELAVNNGPPTPAQLVSNGLSLLQNAVTIVGFVAVLAGMAPWMAVVVTVAALPTLRAELALSRSRAKTMLQLGHASRRESFYAELISSVTAAKEVRLYGLSGLFGARMVAELRKINRRTRNLDLRELRVQTLLTALAATVAGGGLVWAVLAARAGDLSVGDIVVFTAAVAGVQGVLGSAINVLARTHQSLLTFIHYRDVVQAPPDLPTLPDRPVLPVPALRAGIEFRDVWFRYNPALPWVLRGASFTITAGEATALVGLNGAGKSTIVKLLCRFYDPTHGAVLWDGVDLRQFPVAELRQRIGAVFQDFMSYELSAAENIGLGNLPSLDDREAIAETARRAGCDAMVQRLPDGYDTLLTRFFATEDDSEAVGVMLSGGQWQRLALARAFTRAGCDLLILDEPSAGLDADAEHEIHTRLRVLREGATSLLISHRLSAVRDARTILVVTDGVVAEHGTHQDLMRAGGRYAHLFSLQASGYRDEPANATP
ncbi:ABC transporter ATP-binding protein [Actinoplanes flavus]|uniref:ABC transporter ATP-binding protein n=1 Tax=Actinoplanes flavus TaxID=2820290 RepID=A0ABS3UZM7_9ACTN|nr:ABC transporter ATP-binding protein [Actinoplanes flavus]MBO3744027.1 ABC transporter ATP-binding protein [Actinoplanes flavus]